MPTVETLSTVTRDPAGFVDPAFLERVLSRIRSRVETLDVEPSRPALSALPLAAALHRFVYTRSEYADELAPGLNRPPRETLRANGNCADQSLLLYALYREAGIDARLTSAAHCEERRFHAFVEVGFDAPAGAAVDALAAYYRETGVVSTGAYRYFGDDDADYFVADPVSSRYVGDDGGLERMGYVDDDGGIEIQRRFTLYGDADAEAAEARPEV